MGKIVAEDVPKIEAGKLGPAVLLLFELLSVKVGDGLAVGLIVDVGVGVLVGVGVGVLVGVGVWVEVGVLVGPGTGVLVGMEVGVGVGVGVEVGTGSIEIVTSDESVLLEPPAGRILKMRRLLPIVEVVATLTVIDPCHTPVLSVVAVGNFDQLSVSPSQSSGVLLLEFFVYPFVKLLVFTPTLAFR